MRVVNIDHQVSNGGVHRLDIYTYIYNYHGYKVPVK